MIDISVSKDTIKIRGHAEYAENGKDIVCAAVTALVQGFTESVEKLTGSNIKQDISPGRADINIDDENLGEVRLLMDSFFIGISLVADEFPDYVRVQRLGVCEDNEPGQKGRKDD